LAQEHVAGWVPEFMQLGGIARRSSMRLLLASALVGLVAGVGAIAFYIATQFVSHYALEATAGYVPTTRPAGEVAIAAFASDHAVPFRWWLLLLVPTIGGLASGFIVFTFAPEAEGHGTDSVIAAYHQNEGKIRKRVPLVKIIASALTIGSGGSGGREGPIAQIGAGFGSFLAGALRMAPADRRVLCAAGMGAGIAAIFRAPLAGALFASEVLYWSPEFEPEVIMPAGVASVVSYCTFGSAFGWKPLFATPDLTFNNPLQLGFYLLLVVCMVVLAFAYTRSFYGITKWFHALGVPRMLKPAIGACASAVVALVLYFGFGRDGRLLAVMSFGYGALQYAISNETTAGAAVLLAIAVGKILTTGLTIGSGGSGGVFGPSMVIGGCGSGALGIFLHRLAPSLVPHPAAFVIVGMAAFFAAAAKTPFSTLIIVSEMTGGYHLLLPALWVCVLAFVLSDRQSLYGSQLETRSRSPAHRGAIGRLLFDDTRVSVFVDPNANVPVLELQDSLAHVIERFTESRLGVLPVVDDEKRLLGIINLEEVLIATQTAGSLVVAADLMRTDVAPLSAEDRLDIAQERFVDADVLALPVVASNADLRVLAMVKRFDVASAYVQAIHGRPRVASVRPPPAQVAGSRRD
jgi:CIC family chloride channel protein